MAGPNTGCRSGTAAPGHYTPNTGLRMLPRTEAQTQALRSGTAAPGHITVQEVPRPSQHTGRVLRTQPAVSGTGAAGGDAIQAVITAVAPRTDRLMMVRVTPYGPPKGVTWVRVTPCGLPIGVTWCG